MSKEAEFIEHHYFGKSYLTDIWYHGRSERYHSVVSDLDNPAGFDSLEGIRSALLKFKEESQNV